MKLIKESNIYTETFGDTANIRVLSFLIEGRELDYSLTDIAKNANISRASLYRIWTELLSLGIVVPSRVIGNAKLYRVNLKSELVLNLMRVFDSLLSISNKQIIENK
jgi:DNA-binding IclR family transcriptional regulator